MIYGIIGLIVGAVISYFILRNNPKLFNLDEMFKTRRDQMIDSLKNKGVEITDEVRKVINEILN